MEISIIIDHSLVRILVDIIIMTMMINFVGRKNNNDNYSNGFQNSKNNSTRTNILWEDNISQQN